MGQLGLAAGVADGVKPVGQAAGQDVVGLRPTTFSPMPVRGVPLCGVSSGGGWFRGWLGVVEGVVADHGVQGQDAAVGQGEDGLVMAFALVAFALVVGPGDGVGAQ